MKGHKGEVEELKQEAKKELRHLAFSESDD